MIKEKQDIITNSYSNFETAVNLLQNDVFNKILDWLKKNVGSNSNMKTLSKLNKELKGLISTKMFSTPVKGFLKDFDQVESISKKILESENDLDLKDFNLTADKQLIIDEITTSLLNDAMIDANLRTPLKKMLYRYVTTGLPIDKAEKELRSFILTDKESLGFAERYVKVLTMESLSRFDGTINQRVATEYKLDGFRIVGSNIKTTEPQCRGLTTASGEFAQYEVNGKYRVEDLPKIIALMKRTAKSTHKNLDPTNIFILRSHWGCRHQYIPTRLLEKDKMEFDKRFGGGVEDNIDVNKEVEKINNQNLRIEFKPAKNIKEAEDYAKSLGLLTVEYKGLDIEVVNDINKSIFKLKTIMPEIKTYGVGNAQAANVKVKKDLKEWVKTTNLYQKTANQFGVERADRAFNKWINSNVSNVGSNTLAWSTGRKTAILSSGESFDMTKYSGVYVNSKYGKDYNTINSIVDQNEKVGWFTKNAKGFEYIMNHEIGHEIDKTIDFRNSKAFKSIYDKEHAKGINHVIENLSKYGATAGGNARHKPAEMIAEGWAEFITSDNPRPMAKEIGEAMLSEYYNFYVKDTDIKYDTWKNNILKIVKQ